MSKQKKRYTFPKELSESIGKTIEVTQNNIGEMNYRIVPVSAIHPHPNNPRKHNITREDLLRPIDKNDPLFQQKSKELESLTLLSKSIKQYGIRNPVEIYQYNDKFWLVHGERRLFGSILAGRDDIPAKVLKEKPSDFDLKAIQIIENIQREDLTLKELLHALIELITDMKITNTDEEITPTLLHSITFKSLATCSKYLSIINGPTELLQAINEEKVTSLKVAYLIAKEKELGKQENLLQKAVAGDSFLQLEEGISRAKMAENMNKITTHISKRGAIPTKISLGVTKNRQVIKKLVDLVSVDKNYAQFSEIFDKMALETFSDCNNAMRSLIRMMEKIEH